MNKLNEHATLQEIKDYLLIQLDQQFNIRIEGYDVYTNYTDDNHYRLMINIPDTIRKDDSSGIIIDLSKNDKMNQITIWGLEVVLEPISIQHIDEVFSMLETHFNHTTYIHFLDKNQQSIMSGWEPFEKELTQHELLHWLEYQIKDGILCDQSKEEIDNIHTILIKHTYFGELKTYTKDHEGHLKP